MGDTDISPPSIARLNSEVAAVSAKIMVTAMIVLFFMVAFCFFLCLYAKWYWSRNENPSAAAARRGTPGLVAAQRRGLDRDTLGSLPVIVYDPKEFKQGLECSVCLSEISQGEKLRILPKCTHGFHLECIDMWFMSHSTCPLCRNFVTYTKTQESQVVVVGATRNPSDSDSDSDSDLAVHLGEAPTFPTDVRVRSLEEGLRSLVIAIPRDLSSDGLSSPRSTTQLSEDVKSPVVSRLGSLKRMLSRGKRMLPSSSTDVESV